MSQDVKGPDGNIYKFPDGTDKAAAIAYFKKKGIIGKATTATNQSAPNVTSTISQAPSPWSVAGIKHKAATALEKGLELAPAIGGTVGGIVGGAAGAPTGPGAVASAVGGATLGGATGEAASQLTRRALGGGWAEQAPKTSGEAAKSIAAQGAIQGASELVGQGIGAALRPTVSKIVGKIAYASGLKSDVAIEKILGDMEKTAKAEGVEVKTVGDFIKVMDKSKEAMRSEIGAAMWTPVTIGDKSYPLRNVKIMPSNVAERVRMLTTKHISEVELNPEKMKLLTNEAAIYEKPRTFAWLMDRREVLNRELDKFYNMASSEQANYAFHHPEIEAYKTEADAIRETIYPAMDKAAGKPPGYFGDLQNRHGALIALSKAADKNLEQLEVKAKVIRGAPWTEKANISTYGTSSGKPGFALHRIHGLVHTPNPVAKANKQIASAFGNTAGAKVAKAASSKVGMEVMALPLRLLAIPDQPEQEQNQEGVTQQ